MNLYTVNMSYCVHWISYDNYEPIIVSINGNFDMIYYMWGWLFHTNGHILIVDWLLFNKCIFFCLFFYINPKYYSKSVNNIFFTLNILQPIPNIPVPDPNYKTTFYYKYYLAIYLFLLKYSIIHNAPSHTVPAWLKERSCYIDIYTELHVILRSSIRNLYL